MPEELAGLPAPEASVDVQPDVTGDTALDAGNDFGINSEDVSALETGAPEQTEMPETVPEIEGEVGPSPPDWFKALYADPQHGKEAQKLWDRMVAGQNYRTLYPTLADARAAKEALETVGGPEAIQELMQKAQSVDDTDAAFFSGDKQQQAGVISDMFSEDPEAFTSGVLVSLDVISRLDPDRYKGLAGQVLSSVLKPERFDEHVEALREAITSGDQGQVQKLVQALVNWADSKGLSQQSTAKLDPRQSQIEQQSTQLKQQQEQFRADQYRQASESVQADIRTRLESSISEQLGKILPKTREGVRARIARDVFSDIENTIKSDTVLQNNVIRIFHPSASQYNFGKDAQTRVANLYHNKAQQLITSATKKVVSEWTKEVVSQSQQTLRKTQQAASRADITGGAPPGGSSKPALTEEMAKNMSPEDILFYSGPVSRKK